METNIVFVALYDNSHGRYMLQGLIDARMSPCAVFVGSARSTLQYRYRSILRYLRNKGLRETIDRLIYRACTGKDVLRGAEGTPPPDLYTLTRQHHLPLIQFDDINQEETLSALSRYRPDFLVLGGAPLVKRSVLDIPRYGVINTHPAKLPEIRGMDVVGWSLLQEVPLGLTVFFVDEGIDTGPILYFHEVPASSGLTLEQIEQKLQSQAGVATVKALQGFLSGQLTPQAQLKQAGRLYRAMPGVTRRKVNQLLR